MQFPTKTAVLGLASCSAAYFANPMFALALAVLMGMVGVTGNWIGSKRDFAWRFMLSRYIASFIVTVTVFSVGETYVLPKVDGNNLVLIGIAGLTGWFIDMVLAIIKRTLKNRGGLEDV